MISDNTEYSFMIGYSISGNESDNEAIMWFGVDGTICFIKWEYT